MKIITNFLSIVDISTKKLPSPNAGKAVSFFRILLTVHFNDNDRQRVVRARDA